MLQIVPNTAVGFLYIIFLYFPRVNFLTISAESLQAAIEENKSREDKLKRESDELSKRTNLGKSSLVLMFFWASCRFAKVCCFTKRQLKE